MKESPGRLFRKALAEESPLQIVGTINAYASLLAQKSGFRAIYLSGAGVANASYGLPDLGMTNLGDVLEDIRRITAVCDLPLLVDADTGWGSVLNIRRTVQEMTKAGAAGIHIEDQVDLKRCGHRPGKNLVSTAIMVDRLKAAQDAKTDSNFVLMARTDALSSEGLEAAIERANQYVEAGAEMIFAEAVTTLEQYGAFTQAVPVPILANITEFGKTPLFTTAQLQSAGVRMILYPLSAFRAMNAAALNVYNEIRQKGTQKESINQMQTRDELYEYLNYLSYEHIADQEASKK